MTKGPDKATYLQDYSVTVTPRAGLSYWIHYEIRYPNGTRSDQVSLTPVANADGTITYTIPGARSTALCTSSSVPEPTTSTPAMPFW